MSPTLNELKQKVKDHEDNSRSGIFKGIPKDFDPNKISDEILDELEPAMRDIKSKTEDINHV